MSKSHSKKLSSYQYHYFTNLGKADSKYSDYIVRYEEIIRNSLSVLLGRRFSGNVIYHLRRLKKNDRLIIDQSIQEVLLLIGRHTNLRYGSSPEEQRSFFVKRLGEKSTFLRHASISIIHEHLFLLRRSQNNPDLYGEVLTDLLDSKIIEEENYEDYYSLLRLQAAAMLYSIELISYEIKDPYEKDLRNNILYFYRYQDAFPFTLKNQRLAKKIFDQNQIEKSHGPKRDAMALRLKELSEQNGIKCSEATTKRWVRKFLSGHNHLNVIDNSHYLG